MDNYKTIENKLANREAFRGNSLTATAEETWGTFTYKVFSYNTLIASKSWDGSEGEWHTYLNADKYSVTTSRHQNLIKKAWGI